MARRAARWRGGGRYRLDWRGVKRRREWRGIAEVGSCTGAAAMAGPVAGTRVPPLLAHCPVVACPFARVVRDTCEPMGVSGLGTERAGGLGQCHAHWAHGA